MHSSGVGCCVAALRSTALPVSYGGFRAGSCGKIQILWLSEDCRRQVCWDLDRNVVAGECLHGAAGISRTMCWCREGSEVLMHNCVSVCSAHCFSLCFVSGFPTTGFPTFLPSPLFMQTDLLLFRAVSSVFLSGAISIYFLILKFTSVDISEGEISQLSEDDLVVNNVLLSNAFLVLTLFPKKRLTLMPVVIQQYPTPMWCEYYCNYTKIDNQTLKIDLNTEEQISVAKHSHANINVLPSNVVHSRVHPEHRKLKPGRNLLADLRSAGIHVPFVFQSSIPFPCVICSRLAKDETQTVVQSL